MYQFFRDLDTVVKLALLKVKVKRAGFVYLECDVQQNFVEIIHFPLRN